MLTSSRDRCSGSNCCSEAEIANGGLCHKLRPPTPHTTHESLWNECRPMAGSTGAGDLNGLDIFGREPSAESRRNSRRCVGTLSKATGVRVPYLEDSVRSGGEMLDSHLFGSGTRLVAVLPSHEIKAETTVMTSETETRQLPLSAMIPDVSTHPVISPAQSLTSSYMHARPGGSV